MITLTSKQTQIRMIFVSLLLGLILALWAKPAFAQTVASQEQAGSVLAIDKVTVQDGTIAGEIRNKSKNTVRDVQLFIRYTWLWSNEFHPGKDSPERSFLPDGIRRHSPGGIDALQIHAHSAVAQAFGWQIRAADSFCRGLYASYSPESVSARKEWRGTSVEGKSSVEWRGSGDEEQRSDEGGGSSGED